MAENSACQLLAPAELVLVAEWAECEPVTRFNPRLFSTVTRKDKIFFKKRLFPRSILEFFNSRPHG